jgi:hypothetical protein
MQFSFLLKRRAACIKRKKSENKMNDWSDVFQFITNFQLREPYGITFRISWNLFRLGERASEQARAAQNA